jgi:glycosyltransferase
MNKGIAMATGDIIGILNSDDVYAASDVLRQVAKAFQDYQPDCLYGDLLYVSSEKPARVIRYWKAGKGLEKDFYFGWMPPHPSFFVTRQVYQTCGLFDTRFPVASDYEFMLRAMVRYHRKAYYLPQVLVHMRQGGESNRNLQSRKKSFLENHKSWRVNNLKPYFFTIWLKILRKVVQFRLHKPPAPKLASTQ